jgi:hypothetical protein
VGGNAAVSKDAPFKPLKSIKPCWETMFRESSNCRTLDAGRALQYGRGLAAEKPITAFLLKDDHIRTAQG